MTVVTAVGATFLVAACSSSSTDSGATASACTWNADAARAAGLTVVGTPPAIKVGDVFASPTGCNGCGCTPNGFECTHNTCANEPYDASACPSDTQLCPDGAVFRRFGPVCVFQASVCERSKVCTAELKKCPDGSMHGRTGPFCTIPCSAGL